MAELCMATMSDGFPCGHPLPSHRQAGPNFILEGHEGPWWICIDCEEYETCRTCGSETYPARDGTHTSEPVAVDDAAIMAGA